MLVEKYIDLSIPVLKTTDTVKTAIKKFDESQLDQLPVIKEGLFEGILLRDTAENVLEPKQKLEGISLQGQTLDIQNSTHVFEALRLANAAQLEVVGVVDAEKKLVGAVTINSLLRYFNDSFGVRSSGSVIVLSLLERDYSLHEISRIIESNGAKVSMVATEVREEDPYTILVTIKMNLADLSRVIAALQRHNFNVIYSFHKEEFQNKDKERLEHLLRFLEI